jgi:choline dehydrogenase
MAEQRPKTDFAFVARSMHIQHTTFDPEDHAGIVDSIGEQLFERPKKTPTSQTTNVHPEPSVNARSEAVDPTVQDSPRSLYTHIIIGAGASGCFLANRLSADIKNTVLVLEAGENLTQDSMIKDPLLGKDNWINQKLSHAIPIKQILKCGNMSAFHVSSKTVGGASTSGQMLAVRSPRSSWIDLSESMKENETFHGISQFPKERGISGAIQVRQSNLTHSTLSDKVIDAMIDLTGDTQVLDYNVNDAEVCVCKNLQWFQSQNEDGTCTRQDFGNIYLSNIIDALGNGINGRHLSVKTQAFVKRIVFDGTKAESVEYEYQGKTMLAHATSKIILAAGTMSPVILLRSGIGSFPLLESLNLPKIYNNPNVGKFIQNHIGPQLLFKTDNEKLLKELVNKYDLGNVAIGFHAPQPNPNDSTTRRWMVMCNASGEYLPHSVNEMLNIDSSKAIHLMGLDLCPSSQGEISLSNGQTNSVPVVNPNFYSTDDDIQNAINMMIYLYEIYREVKVNQDPEDNFQLVWPSEQIFIDSDRNAILKAILAFPNVAQHWAGGCAIGKVVDGSFNVNGVSNLMVVDASVMPNICSGNPLSTVVGISHHASKMLQKE